MSLDLVRAWKLLCWPMEGVFIIKDFQFTSGLADDEVLEALLLHPDYDDDYVYGSKSNEPRHGPYRLDAFTVTSYLPVTAEAACDELYRFAGQRAEHTELRGADHDAAWGGQGNKGYIERLSPGTLPPEFDEWFDAEVRPLFASASTVYALDDLGEAAVHELGDILTDFLEYIALDHGAHRLVVLVAFWD